MTNKIKVNILRAFVDEHGDYGNLTGIIVDVDQNITSSVRQKIARQLHFTDTIFINTFDPVNISFFTPQNETKFAGDSLISTAYLLKHVLGKKFDFIICKAGSVKTWEDGQLTWIESGLDGTPPWNHLQLKNPQEVDNITPEEAAKFEHTMVWAWADEINGIIRSRTFLLDWDTLEDQGNGSGSMQLANLLNRKIEIHQGKGSVIYASPAGQNSAKVGGRVKVKVSITRVLIDDQTN